MPHEIKLLGNVPAELRSLRAYDRQRILDDIESQLRHEPTVETRNRKPLLGLTPSFDHIPPVWELRVGEFRVFYDVDSVAEVVSVRAVRRKKPGQTTEDIT
jgi:mRNA-degrading endonuclease RelE of RelBE toxin-antitoxin system